MVDEPYKDEDWLRERWFSDMCAVDIADEAGCSDRSVHRYAKKFDFPPKNEIATDGKPYRDEEWLRERWFSGRTLEEIADEADCSRLPISEWAEKFGFPPKEDARPWADADRIEEMYHGDGMPIEAIADELGCTYTAVRGTMLRNDIERRDWGEHMKKPDRLKTHRKRGHEQVTVTLGGNTHYYDVHRILAIAHWGLDEVAGKIVHHKNGIPWDNRIENLELLGSQSEHAKMHNEDRDRDGLGRYV